jgi:hypothetical protein
MKNGFYYNLVIAVWSANCVFWMQLFMSDLLANLTNRPLFMINNLEQVIANKNLKILIDKTSFIYLNLFKVLLNVIFKNSFIELNFFL